MLPAPTLQDDKIRTYLTNLELDQ
eukprot:SAG22_NODE_11547_length_479_cov_1.715789_1_plen_23_part_01